MFYRKFRNFGIGEVLALYRDYFYTKISDGQDVEPRLDFCSIFCYSCGIYIISNRLFCHSIKPFIIPLHLEPTENTVCCVICHFRYFNSSWWVLLCKCCREWWRRKQWWWWKLQSWPLPEDSIYSVQQIHLTRDKIWRSRRFETRSKKVGRWSGKEIWYR